MKKIINLLLVLLLVMACLTACTNETSIATEPEPNTVEETELLTENEVDFSASSLIIAYCDNRWDGSFIHNTDHCASIINGELWLDNQKNEAIPDMGPLEDCFWDTVIGTENPGTWIYDHKLGTIELWDHGIRQVKILTEFKDSSYRTEVHVLSNCIVARKNTELEIFNKSDASPITSSKEIVDCYKNGNDTVVYSTFQHKNFEISGNTGKEKELQTHFVRFHRENVQLKEEPNCCTLPFNNYWNGGWDRSLSVIDNNFYYIDFYGDIYCNNELVGNINTGISLRVSEGSNVLTGDSSSFYCNGKELIIYQRGEKNAVDIPDGECNILWHDDTNGIVILIYGKSVEDNTLIIVNDGKVTTLSDNVSDAYVAYDTIYYMEGDKVYRYPWEEEKAKAELFCEGAYAVSQRSDELEGAIVPSDKNNMASYGENNLYSPYGDK